MVSHTFVQKGLLFFWDSYFSGGLGPAMGGPFLRFLEVGSGCFFCCYSSSSKKLLQLLFLLLLFWLL